MPLGKKPNTPVEEGDYGFTRARADLEKSYPLLGRGYSRIVFDGGDVVYKIGSSRCNEIELRCYEDKDFAYGVPVVPCRIVYHESGTSILIMETVRPIHDEEQLPDWSGQVDSHQVGLDRNGNYVCFDAGSRPVSREEANRRAWKPVPTFMQAHKIPIAFEQAA